MPMTPPTPCSAGRQIFRPTWLPPDQRGGPDTGYDRHRQRSGGIAGELTVTGSDGTVTIKGQSAIRSALGNPSLIITKKDGGTMTGSATLPAPLSPLRRGQGRTEAFPSIYMEAVLAMVSA